jgi:hypothetical protein
VNRFIAAAIGFAESGKASQSVILIALPAGGMLLCWRWAIVTGRGYDYLEYWIQSTQEPSGARQVIWKNAFLAVHDILFGKPVTFERDGET